MPQSPRTSGNQGAGRASTPTTNIPRTAGAGSSKGQTLKKQPKTSKADPK